MVGIIQELNRMLEIESKLSIAFHCKNLDCNALELLLV